MALPGITFIFIGIGVLGISFLLGIKFLFFRLVGIGLFCYGIGRLYIMRGKAHERIQTEQHTFSLATHRLAHPLPNNKSCYYCTTLLPPHAKYCFQCGTEV